LRHGAIAGDTSVVPPRVNSCSFSRRQKNQEGRKRNNRAAASEASAAATSTTGEAEGIAPAKKKKGRARGGKRLTGNQLTRKWKAKNSKEK
jgi:hypothetical protein